MWFYAGEAASLTVDFRVDGEYVVPTSATYTLRDHLGAAVVTAEALTVAGTTLILEIPSSYNEIGSSSLFENRFVLVKFIHNGKPHTNVYPYHLTNFVPMTATTADVRRLTGLMENELPDQDIDLTSAYFFLFDAHSTSFSSQLLATDFRARVANEAIALQAAIEVVGSFPFRVPVSARNEDSQFARVSTLNFREIEMELRRKLQQALTTVLSVEETTVGVFSVSSPTDPYTGA